MKIMLSLLSNFWSRTIRTKAQLPWLSTRTTLFMCSWLLAHRRQTSKKKVKDHPNLLPVLEVALEQRTAMHRVWVASFVDINQPGIWRYHRTSSAVPCSLCHTLYSVTVLSNNTHETTKKKKKKIVRCQCTTKLTHVSSFSESHTSHGRARHQVRDWSESGRSRELLTPGTMTHAGRAASSHEIFRPFLTVCLTVFPFEFRPRTFIIGFYGKKSFISELMILECSFPLNSCLALWYFRILGAHPSTLPF